MGARAAAVDVAVLSPCATSSVLPFSFAGSLSGLYMALGAVDRSVGWHVDVCDSVSCQLRRMRRVVVATLRGGCGLPTPVPVCFQMCFHQMCFQCVYLVSV